MKKLGLLILFAISFYSYAQRTLPTIENFDYTLGELRTVGADWSRISGAGNDLNVINGNLSYSGYSLGPVGRQVQLNNGGADDVKLTFNQQTGDGTTVYSAFLLNVESTTGLGTGAYFASIGSGTTTVSYGTRCWIRNGFVANTFNLGLSRGSNTVIGWTSDLNINTTHLVVLLYKYEAGTSNDSVKLWVNPDLSGSEPTATIAGNSAGTADNSLIDGFYFRQAAGTPTAKIDGILVGNDWNEAPLPVELTSFSAAVISKDVKLNWNTATEINNYGFEVERMSKVKRQTSDEWQKIGFVNGNGNSNSPKSYSFVDDKVNAGKYSYRLKQIDNDGQYEYSKTIEVDVNGVKEYKLTQNYPNPFNPTTTIQYILPQAGNVKLTLYNILGQEIRTLVNEMKEAGTHTINFDAGDLNSGMYIYKIESGSFVQTRKMTLVK